MPRIADALELDPTDLYAYIGMVAPQGLPDLAPYLRVKYHLGRAEICNELSTCDGSSDADNTNT